MKSWRSSRPASMWRFPAGVTRRTERLWREPVILRSGTPRLAASFGRQAFPPVAAQRRAQRERADRLVEGARRLVDQEDELREAAVETLHLHAVVVVPGPDDEVFARGGVRHAAPDVHLKRRLHATARRQRLVEQREIEAASEKRRASPWINMMRPEQGKNMSAPELRSRGYTSEGCPSVIGLLPCV